jgi:hypothetical protein
MKSSISPGSAGPQSHATTSDPGVRVTLRLTGMTEREQHGLAAHLIASMDPAAVNSAPRTLVGFVHIEGPTGVPNLGAPTRATELSPQDFERLNSALDRAWRTGTDVDVVDELGRPLLQGALNAHPSGVSRWLFRP